MWQYLLKKTKNIQNIQNDNVLFGKMEYGKIY